MLPLTFIVCAIMLPHGSVKLIAEFIIPILIGNGMVENTLAVQFDNLLDEKTSMYSKEARSESYPISNGTVYENGILHVEINELNPALKQIKTIENAFKNILAMNGVKYVYKRNFYWRTWREVEDIEGKSKLVCYRCQNVFNVTCTSCNCGYWEIEENPPCPFELFSVINSTDVCGAYYHQLKNSNCKCPSILSFKDLGKCGNPLESIWRISRHYSTDISGRNVNVICKERENCIFSTVYSIFPDHVTFRLINSSNNIMYSKVMKNGNKNYACLESCGILSKSTFTQTASDRRTPILDAKHTTLKGNEKTIKDSINTMKPNNKHRNKSYLTKIATTASILHCKHLLLTHSDENSLSSSEYND